MTPRIYTSAIFLSGFTILMALACADYGDSPIGPGGGVNTVSFAADIRDTLAVRCANPSCHGGTPPTGGFSITTASWNEIRNGSGDHGAVLIPGDASTSNLHLKTTSNPPFGFRMPMDGPPFLSLEAQTAIRDWIDQGALDN